MRLLALVALVVALAGCSSEEGVRVVAMRVGWDATGTMQSVEPSVVEVKQGDRVRLVVTNGDDPARDYNGATPGRDNYHELVLEDYDGDGDGRPDEIRHEVPAGMTVATQFKGRDHFVASEAGSFRLVCTIMTSPSHEARGMNATFVVR